MEPEERATFEPNDEVDELRWLIARGAPSCSPTRTTRELVRRRLALMNRDRFPGLADGWARLDGPAGTQMVDTAIEAMADWMRSGRNANHGGVFAAAHATDEVVERRAPRVARRCSAPTRAASSSAPA